MSNLITTDTTRQARLLAAVIERVPDPRAQMALIYCGDQITEPPLNLREIRECLGASIRTKIPCCRTIQRWVKKCGMPYSRDISNDRRIYFLSKVFSWYQETFPCTSVVEEAEERARKSYLAGVVRGGSATRLRASSG